MRITPIRLRRANMGIETLKELADKLNISESYLYKLEQGHQNPSAELIVRMAKVFNCTTDEIFKDFNMM